MKTENADVYFLLSCRNVNHFDRHQSISELLSRRTTITHEESNLRPSEWWQVLSSVKRKWKIPSDLRIPRSPYSLRGSVVEQRSAESEDLRFDFSWGLWIFSLSHTRKISFTISLPSSKLTIFLSLFTNMTLSTLLILAVRRTRVIWTS